MKLITRDSPDYMKYVIEEDEQNYVINLETIPKNTAVQCPYDGDMFAGIDDDGEMFLAKKTVLTKPFKKLRLKT